MSFVLIIILLSFFKESTRRLKKKENFTFVNIVVEPKDVNVISWNII
jgi:hypothetical protein